MAKQHPDVTYQWCFLEKHIEACICQSCKSFSPIYFQLYHKVLPFYTGIYFIKLYYKVRRVIVTCNDYYSTDSQFMKSSILKPITES